jgi:hypothetical protein
MMQAEESGEKEQHMTKYAIRYARIPTNYNDTRVALVEAETPEIAKQLLAHQLGDHSGVRNYVIGDPEVYQPVESKGRVLLLNQDL